MILRFLYNRYKRRFQDFLIEDLLKDIPPKVSEQAVSILTERREILTKWLYWQAHTVSRRDPTDFINLERKLGILVQIKMMLLLIGNAPRGEEDHPVYGTTVAPPEDWMTPVEAFKKGNNLNSKGKEK